QANSTTSSPRVTSPWASEKTLPCSLVISRATSSRRSSSSVLKRNITRARTSGGVFDQLSNAAWAAAMASRVASAEDSDTYRRGSPVAGLKTVAWRSERPATASLLIRLPRVCMRSLLVPDGFVEVDDFRFAGHARIVARRTRGQRLLRHGFAQFEEAFASNAELRGARHLQLAVECAQLGEQLVVRRLDAVTLARHAHGAGAVGIAF